MSSARRVLIVTGEASGDAHAAGLVREARRLDPTLQFEGMGGPALRDEGVTVLFDAADVSVVGITEVLEHIGPIWRRLRALKQHLAASRPDLLLLVDFPDFNLRLASEARRLGIPVVYFISPSVWAWRTGRVHRIKRDVTRMLTLFPFEKEFYDRHGVPATFVGHPVADGIPQETSVTETRRRLGLDRGAPVFALLPGSRTGEIRRLLDPLLETARETLRFVPKAAFLIPIARTVDAALLESAAARSGLPVVALSNSFDEIAAASDAAVAASGTAVLELAVRGVPAVVVYRTTWTTYAVGRLALKVPHISLVNLLTGREVLPELIQNDFTPEAAARELIALGMPGPRRDAALIGLAEVREKLGAPGAYRRAAAALLEVLAAEGRR
jgi:lipid-A-disaccharide synthase